MREILSESVSLLADFKILSDARNLILKYFYILKPSIYL